MVFDTRFKIKSSENKLWYKQSATCFNNALPLGNGRIGAIVFGGVEEEKISINEDTLWSGYPRKNNIEDYPSVYRKAIEMFDKGEKTEAQKYFEDNFGAASGIIEMLVQCDKEGNVKLLPALPDSWKNGQVKNLRLPGKKSVSFAWENGKIIYSEIKENVKC